MANNGYLVGGVCYPSFSVPVVCPASNSSYAATIYNTSGVITEVRCWNSNFTSSLIVPVPSINCEISGPPLTETQQIEAINELFPSAVAILAIAWGFKYIRVLVAEWLKERNASD